MQWKRFDHKRKICSSRHSTMKERMGKIHFNFTATIDYDSRTKFDAIHIILCMQHADSKLVHNVKTSTYEQLDIILLLIFWHPSTLKHKHSDWQLPYLSSHFLWCHLSSCRDDPRLNTIWYKKSSTHRVTSCKYSFRVRHHFWFPGKSESWMGRHEVNSLHTDALFSHFFVRHYIDSCWCIRYESHTSEIRSSKCLENLKMSRQRQRGTSLIIWQDRELIMTVVKRKESLCSRWWIVKKRFRYRLRFWCHRWLNTCSRSSTTNTLISRLFGERRRWDGSSWQKECRRND